MNTEEGMTAGDMIQAFETRDNEVFESLKSRQCLKFLDNEVAKLAFRVHVPGGGPIAADHAASSGGMINPASRSSSRPNVAVEDESFC